MPPPTLRRYASSSAAAAAADADEDDRVPLVAAPSSSSSSSSRAAMAPARQRREAATVAAGLLALILLLVLAASSTSSDSSDLDQRQQQKAQRQHILELATQLTPICTQVVHRHGDRTPITPLADAAYWSTLLPSAEALGALARRTHVVRDDDASSAAPGAPGAAAAHAAGGGAVFGRLTSDGIRQMVEVGIRLRDDADRLLRGEEDEGQWLRVASTDFSRTLQSVQAVLAGLLLRGPPPDAASALRGSGASGADVLEAILSDQRPYDGLVVDVDSRHTQQMIPDPQPRRFVGQAELEAELLGGKAFAGREETRKPLARRLTRILLESGVIDGEALRVSFGVGEDGAAASANKQQPEAEVPTDLGRQQPPQPPAATGAGGETSTKPLAWNQLAEILTCLEVRGKLPPSITESELRGVHEHNAWRWFALLSDRRLGPMAIGSLAKKLLMNASAAANSWKKKEEDDSSMGWVRSSSVPLLHVFSGHDATLIALLCFFRLERPAVWPNYGSYLKVELLRDDIGLCQRSDFDGDCATTAADDNYYILFSLNGEPLRSEFFHVDSQGRNMGYRYFVPWDDLLEGQKDIESRLPPLAYR